jgi:hypothetical protein
MSCGWRAFGIFKRGMVGIYQHCGEQHIQLYLDVFTFRWNNRSKLGIEDQERARIAAYGMNEQRLTYRRTEAGQNAAPVGTGRPATEATPRITPTLWRRNAGSK